MNYDELETSTLLDVVDRSHKEVRVLAERLTDSRNMVAELKIFLAKTDSDLVALQKVLSLSK
tara:strand:+ start:3103 stop:3288 length:186 start_codon:yes stop_codon:yes gene_type:complete